MAASEVPLSTPVWPYRANWRDKVELTYEFKTTIKESQNGKEQRRALRVEPRVGMSASMTAMDEREFQGAQRLLVERQNAPFAFPDYARGRLATVTTNGINLNVSKSTRWLLAGTPVVLAKDDEVQLRRVQANAGGFLTLTSPTTFTGVVRVYPAIYGYFADKLSMAKPTDATAEIGIEIAGEPGYQTAVYRGAAGTMFDGREVFAFRADWQGRAFDVETRVTLIDFDSGRIDRITPIKFGNRTFRGTFLCGTRDEQDDLVGFFMRCYGRQKEFFAPTGNRDLTYLGKTGNAILCAPTGQVSFASNVVDRCVAIYLKDGSVSYHKVTSIYAASGGAPTSTDLDRNPDGTVSVNDLETLWTPLLTRNPDGSVTVAEDSVPTPGDNMAVALNPAPPEGLAVSTVLRVSWMPLARFASDRITIPNQTDEAARIELTIQTLEYLPAET